MAELNAARMHRVPTLIRVAVIYLAARLVTTLMLALAAQLSGSASRFGADATVGSFVLGWDAQWYWLIALDGYPTDLPRTDSGEVAENSWAFMPVYAYLARGLGSLLGSWGLAALFISLLAGFGAAVMLYFLLRERIGVTAATWAVAFFSCAPLAAMFQVGYAESLFLLLLFTALWLVVKRRYAWLLVLIPVMGYTRPGILAFALFLGLHGIWRWYRRRDEPLPVRQIILIIASGLLATAVGFSWQVIAAVVTGEPSAYLSTELAWRRNWLPAAADNFVPFDGFIQASGFWFARWGLPALVGPVVLVLLVAGFFAALLWWQRVRVIGVDLRLWCASYLIYLLAVFFPQSSVFRLLVPLSPLWGAFAAPRSLIWRLVTLLGCLLGQWVWIENMYAQANTFWQIP